MLRLWPLTALLPLAAPGAEGRALVTYAYFDKRAQAPENLRFFLEVGLPAQANPAELMHLLVVNGYELSVAVPSRSDVQVMKRRNEGFDFGAHTYGLKMFANQSRTTADELPYDHYIFLNCGVRGPFLPAFMPADYHWSQAFTARFNSRVKAVGTSLICLTEQMRNVIQNPKSRGPKLEGFAFALDKEGLQTVWRKGTSFQQHKTKVAAILDGEYGLTMTLMQNGFTIDTLLLAYQGVDWTDERNWKCNNGNFASRKGAYFGITTHPLETIFQKTSWKGRGLLHRDALRLYTKWATDSRGPRIASSLRRRLLPLREELTSVRQHSQRASGDLQLHQYDVTELKILDLDDADA